MNLKITVFKCKLYNIYKLTFTINECLNSLIIESTNVWHHRRQCQPKRGRSDTHEERWSDAATSRFGAGC